MPQGQGVNSILASPLFPAFFLFVIFYFLFFRPQKKKEKERQKMLEGLTKNDEVVTTSGIHGTVVSTKEKTVIVRVDDNVKIEFEKTSIALIKKAQSA